VRWTIHGERSLYDSEWVRLHLADVELPDGERFEHHLIRAPMPAAGVVVRDAARGVLLLWRHRFITDSWGWEIPAGMVEPGESIQAAATREVLEETGWQPGRLETLVAYHPSNGLSDQTFHLFLADGATEVGPPVDVHEAEQIAWVPVSRLTEAVRGGQVRDGLSLTAVCWCLAFGLLMPE
jgi:8-oxo-dGTP pyrophosphatase MutT (NUDIX family)